MSKKEGVLSHLKNIASTGSPRSSRRWSQPIVQLCSWPAINDLSEGFAEVVAEEGVEKRVYAAVGVGENMTDYLHHYRRRGKREHLQGLGHQYHLQRRDITDDIVDDTR